MKIGGGKYQFLVLIVFGFILNLAWASQVFCYDTRVAHPGIADLAVKFYNQNNNKKISVEQLGWIKTGAQEEDVPTRWFNHFYDPVYNRGLNFLGRHVSGKEWSKSFQEQKNYALGDKSWPRAINDYRRGDYENAFRELGHNIHLVSDVLVPAHTRDDTHALPPDSYEEYVKDNWGKLSQEIKGEVINKNSLDDIFDSAAKYSNNNFYSDDTIEDKKYNIIQINDKKVLKQDVGNPLTFYLDNSGKNLFYSLGNSDWKNFGVDEKSLDHPLILSDYAKNLLPKAVGYSANVIKLFFDETQRNQKEKLPFFRIGLKGVANYLAGTAVTVGESIYDNVRAQKPEGQIGPISNTENLINNLTNSQSIRNNTVLNKINTKTNNKLNSNQMAASPTAVVSPQESMRPVESYSSSIQAPIVHNNVTNTGFSYSGGSYNGMVDILPTTGYPSTVIVVTNTQSIVNNNEILVSTSTSNANTSSQSILYSTSTVSDFSVTTTTATTIVTGTPPLFTDTSSTHIISSSTTLEVVDTSLVNQISSSTFSTSTIQDVSAVATSTNTATSTVFSTSSLVIAPSTSTSFFTTTSPNTSSTVVNISTSTVSNTTTTVSSTPEIVSDVVINEIAWAGTSAATDQDEYIELFNNTDQDITLFPVNNVSKWWKIMIGNQEISISKIINRVIPKNGYFLLERTDDRTVNEISADIIYSGTLKNSGERVRLIDGNNQLVDEVDNASGWFAGSASSTYASMERINSRTSAGSAPNWQTSDGPRLVGKVDGGGDDIPLNGSPKQINFGPVVLKSRQLEIVRNLKKSVFPYILTYYEVPVGKILNIEAGTIIKTYYPDSKISVSGELNINGTVNDRVVITSGRDNTFSSENFNTTFGSRSGMAQAKDWQGLIFNSGALANLSGLDMRYAGKAFKAPGSNMWDPLVSQAVRSGNAVVNVDSSVFADNGETVLYFLNSTSSIKNTNLNKGQLAIENYGGYLDLKNISLNNFSNSNGPVYVKNVWPKITQISFNQNAQNSILIDQASIVAPTSITKEIPISLKDITVESGAELNIESGTTVKFPRYANMFIKGTLNLNGTNNEPVNLIEAEPLNNYNYWGRLIFEGGKGNFKSANISGGWGSVATYDQYQGMVVVNNSQLYMEDCQLLNSRPPGNFLEIINSKVDLNDSSIGYIGSKPNFTNTNGIKINSGELILNNSTLMNLDTGLIAGDVLNLPKLQLNNMDSRNFINVNKFWDPNLWYSDFIINSSTTSITTST